MTLAGYLVLILVVFVSIFRSIFVAHEKQRIVVSQLGKLVNILGPGLVLKTPFLSRHYSRLTVGDSGKLLTKDSAEFNEVNVPVTLMGDASPGDLVIVTRFDSGKNVFIERDKRTKKSFNCEKCGHENEVVVG